MLPYSHSGSTSANAPRLSHSVANPAIIPPLRSDIDSDNNEDGHQSSPIIIQTEDVEEENKEIQMESNPSSSLINEDELTFAQWMANAAKKKNGKVMSDETYRYILKAVELPTWLRSLIHLKMFQFEFNDVNEMDKKVEEMYTVAGGVHRLNEKRKKKQNPEHIIYDTNVALQEHQKNKRIRKITEDKEEEQEPKRRKTRKEKEKEAKIAREEKYKKKIRRTF